MKTVIRETKNRNLIRKGSLRGKQFRAALTKESKERRIQRRLRAAYSLLGMWGDKDTSFFDKDGRR
ncbi:hypothetical protein F9B85_03520 [Heliorestis acidaminivorans]|uniref:Uncharacterized protein n=1 Tax=Heliorestis acidaminivorans TaxID=553427 RepID=A0A6I0F2B3_9FIRM|nr:hypothetical protein [Heliorestis acidaminivorans]KAB2953700.1 hypothetical protein F9B85_03520 [Heliorestis acidaminivorans]